MNHQRESSEHRSSTDSPLHSTRVSFYFRSPYSYSARLFKHASSMQGKVFERRVIEAMRKGTSEQHNHDDDDDGKGSSWLTSRLGDPLAVRVSDILKISWVRAWWPAGRQSRWPATLLDELPSFSARSFTRQTHSQDFPSSFPPPPVVSLRRVRSAILICRE